MKTNNSTSKKIIALALVFVMLVTIFVGCGKKEPENADANESGKVNVSQSEENKVSEEFTVSTDENNTDTVSQTENDSSTSAEGEVTRKNSAETTTKKNSTGKIETTTKKATSSTGSSSSSSSGSSSSNKGNTTTNSTVACSHSWKLQSYTNGCYVYHCSKCDEYKSEERKMNPDDFMGNKSEYLELLGYINQARRKAGLKELLYCSELQSGADTRAKELTVKYSHTRPNGQSGSSAFDYSKVNAQGEYIAVGENIVANATTAKQAFNAWMNSSAHRSIIMKDCATHFVVSRCNGYWIMITIGPYDEVLYG